MNDFFINHITNSISNAEQYKSKLPLELLSMNGMSGKKTRHFYNNMGEMNELDKEETILEASDTSDLQQDISNNAQQSEEISTETSQDNLKNSLDED